MPPLFRTLGLSHLIACLFVASALWLAAAPARAQLTFLSTYSFNYTNGGRPGASLVQGRDGNFYGTAPQGGANGVGTVFKVTPGGVLTTLVSFNGADGANPACALVLGSDGNFYGTTSQGGAFTAPAGIGYGTVFQVTPMGTLTTLVSFNGVNGAAPHAGLVPGSDGNFYGTTSQGGAFSEGTVFKITPTGALTTLHSFTATSSTSPYANSDGASPEAALVLGTDGNFYGTTFQGGANGNGTVFKIMPSGALTTLASSGSQAALALGSDGNFYGTSEYGGVNNTGTVFQVTPAGALTTLHSFAAIPPNYVNADGAYPAGALVLGADSNFYGTSEYGGANGDGTVFKITPTGALTTLVNFTGANGALPQATLVLGSDGNFYGTTPNGGTSLDGTVFQVTSAGALTTLVNFNYTNGEYPEAALVQSSDGNFYGTTSQGGTSNDGTVFKVTSAGSITTLLNFNGADGALPQAALLLNTDGNFYGTTSQGGANGNGTVFKITPAGALTTLYSFSALINTDNADGASPTAALVLGSDGNFYGTSEYGGANGDGTVFKITPTGALITLVNFTGGNGANPEASLVLGSDGNFYGTTAYGGAFGGKNPVTGMYGDGTIFQLTPTGALTTLHNFSALTSLDNTDGAYPVAGLVMNTDGNFYGTTSQGGANGNGTVFKITPAGALTTLYNFSALTYYRNTDGTNPACALVLGSDGNFYGTTAQGGAAFRGTVFQITPAGTLTALHSFGESAGDGTNPACALVLGSDGNFYGTAPQGGANNGGTIFGLFGPPTTFGASESTPENTPVTFTVAFDDPCGKGIASIAFATPPAHGALTVGAITETGTTGTVTLTYTPNANTVGSDIFTYAVTGYTGVSSAQTVTINVNPPDQPASVALGATSVYGSQSTTLTVTLSAPAPAGGLVVALSSNNTAAASLPATVTVAAGQTVSPPVTVTTFPVYSMSTVTLTASANGGAAATTLQVNTPIIQSMTISPSQISGGGSATLTVTLNVVVAVNPTAYGVIVNLASNNAAATVPSYINIRQGTTSATTTIQTTVVSTTQTATITGTAFGTSGSATLTIAVPPPTVTLTFGTQTSTQATLSATATSGDGTPLHYIWGLAPSATPGFTGAISGTAVSGTPFSNTLAVNAPGSYSVTVSVTDAYGQTATATQSATFSQVPTTVIVSPATVKLLEHGTQTFAATVKDQFGNALTPASLTWSVSGGGTIDQSGDFTAGTIPGTFTVTASATSNGVTQTGTAAVTVLAPPTVTITLGTQTPTQVSLSVTATSSNGTALTYAWSVSPTAIYTGATTGSAASGAAFSNTLTPSAAGTYTVTVTVTDAYGQTGTASQAVAFSQVPTAVTVSPATASVPENGTQAFTATVTDQFGAVISAPSVAWSVSGGGTINVATGAFTAGTAAGTFAVTARATSAGASVAGTAAVTVFSTVPTVMSFSPASGPVGTVVTINGTHLNGVTAVRFHNASATVFSANAAGTQLTVTVPKGAGTGTITITTPGGSVKTATNFTVTNPAPTITSFTPASGPIGTVVTLTGTNLSGVSVVRFHNANAKTFAANGAGTQITVTVPSGAGTGTITVTTPGGSAKTAKSFTVTGT